MDMQPGKPLASAADGTLARLLRSRSGPVERAPGREPPPPLPPVRLVPKKARSLGWLGASLAALGGTLKLAWSAKKRCSEAAASPKLVCVFDSGRSHLDSCRWLVSLCACNPQIQCWHTLLKVATPFSCVDQECICWMIRGEG